MYNEESQALYQTRWKNSLVYKGLTLFVPMEFPRKFDTVKSGWLIVYIEGSQVIIAQTYCISFSEDQIYISKQSRP